MTWRQNKLALAPATLGFAAALTIMLGFPVFYIDQI